MLGDGKWNSGDQGSFFKYQYGVLKLLEAINASIAGLPGIDYELVYFSYKANTTVGGCFNNNDFIQRVDIVNAATGVVTSQIWYDQTLGTILVGACIPLITQIDPYIPPSNVSANIVQWLGSVAPTVGQKVMADSLPVVIASDQTAVPVSSTTLATAALQTALNALITTLNGTVSTAALQTALNALITTLNGTVSTSALQTTLNGLVATAANQVLQTALLTTIDADTSNLDVLLSTRASAANQTTLGSQTTKINDGTNTAAVKAAATAPVAADPALVVAISPNSTLPVTLPTGVQAITSVTFPVGVGASIVNATSAGFTTDSAFTGSINGVTRAASTFYGFEATPGKTLPAIACVIGAGTITIDSIV